MKTYKIEKTRKGRTDVIEGTVKELTKYFSYTLEVGASYNSKINRFPTTIKSLISNLEKALDEKEGSCFERTYIQLIGTVTPAKPTENKATPAKPTENKATPTEDTESNNIFINNFKNTIMKELVSAAKELNKVLGLEPAIKVVGIKKTTLEEAIKEAAEYIEPEDVLTKETQKVIDALTAPAVTKTADEETDEAENDDIVVAVRAAKEKAKKAGEKATKEPKATKAAPTKEKAEKAKKAPKEKVESMYNIAKRLLQADAADDVVEAEFVAAYAAKGKTDLAFIKQRITTYMGLAAKELGIEIKAAEKAPVKKAKAKKDAK